MNKLAWLYNRLKAMSILEIFHRIKQKIVHKINRIKFSKSKKAYEYILLNIDEKMIYKNLNEVFNDISIDFNLDSDEFIQFNKTINLAEKINWHKGIKGLWDKEKNSYEIEFKNTDDIGDIRFSWEINRHQFMPFLAIKYLKLDDKKYLDLLEIHFEDWMENNKFLKGINWSSSMEIALRAYQWLIVLYILRDCKCTEFKNKITRSILFSTEYVMKNLSLYSSANNHLILEVAISSIIGYCFKDVYKQKWFEKGYEILEKELKNQFHIDGVNKEQALHYQAFVTDIMLQYNSIMRNINKQPIQEDLIKKSIEFMAVLEADKFNCDFGDSDDAKIITFSSKKENYYNYLLTFGSCYYKEKFTDKLKNYCQIQLFTECDFEIKEYKRKDFNLYKDGGYSVINQEKNKLVFDFGELGFGTLAAHGHADALMFMYINKEKPFFVDSGTYIYNIERERRDYYRGTECHNTLTYNNLNQSEIRGPFLWGKKAQTKLINYIKNDKGYVLEGEHNGYNPNIHRRKIECSKGLDTIYIYDYFDKKAKMNFILDSNVIVKKIEDNIYSLTNGHTLYMYVDGEAKIESTKISKIFLCEDETIKINVSYDFRKEHITCITEKLDTVKVFKKERKTVVENC